MILIQFNLNENLYLRDPQLTKLGRNIIKYSIKLIEELGFEKFTFKKLAEVIDSTEASIYRYFENKHKLLVYLVSWYWEWMKYQINYQTMNLEDPERILRIVLSVLVDSSQNYQGIEYVDEQLLHRIVVAESTKAYHTKEVDEENRIGFFANYKSLCKLVSEKILAYSPQYPYPRALASTLVEMANSHQYFAEHLPLLTDVDRNNGDILGDTKKLLEHFAFSLIQNYR